MAGIRQALRAPEWTSPCQDSVTFKVFQLVLGIAVSAIALYVVLSDIHWQEVRASVQEADYALLAIALVLYLIVILARALRWRVILQPEPGRQLKTRHLFGSLNVAYFINNVLPFQTGDLWRAFLLSELNGMSASRALSSVVVERVLDVLTLLLLLLVLVPFLDIPAWAKGPSITFACVFSALAVALILAALKRSFALRIFERLLAFAPTPSRPKLRQMAGAFLDGLEVMTKPGATAQLLGYSVVTWLLASGVMFAGLRAFNVDVGAGAAVFLIVATTFGFFVPSTPGAFGLYHAIVIATLERVFEVDKNLAVSFALVIHLVFYLPPMIIGPLFLIQERRIWRRGSFMDKLRELGGKQPVEVITSNAE